MKLKLILLSFFMSAVLSNAASTFQFSNTANFATNWLNGSGGISTMVWGMVIDANGNGFSATDLTPYSSFGNISANANGIVLSTTAGTSDDVLYISSNLMNLTTNTTDSGTVGLNRVTNMTNLVYGNGVTAGDRYRLIWFDVTSFGGASQGVKYGMFELPSASITVSAGNSIPGNTIGADPGTYNYGAAFAGADAPKSMSMTIGVPVPEASTSLLGAIGALALLRRRRN